MLVRRTLLPVFMIPPFPFPTMFLITPMAQFAAGSGTFFDRRARGPKGFLTCEVGQHDRCLVPGQGAAWESVPMTSRLVSRYQGIFSQLKAPLRPSANMYPLVRPPCTLSGLKA